MQRHAGKHAAANMIDRDHQQHEATKKVQFDQALRFSLHAKPERDCRNRAAKVEGAAPAEVTACGIRVYPHLRDAPFGTDMSTSKIRPANFLTLHRSQLFHLAYIFALRVTYHRERPPRKRLTCFLLLPQDPRISWTT